MLLDSPDCVKKSVVQINNLIGYEPTGKNKSSLLRRLIPYALIRRVVRLLSVAVVNVSE